MNKQITTWMFRTNKARCAILFATQVMLDIISMIGNRVQEPN